MILVTLLFALSVHAQGWHAEHEAIYDTRAAEWISFDEVSVPVGGILVFGEEHATQDNFTEPATIIHHDNQVRMIKQLMRNLGPVSVGMEFLTYTFQDLVDSFLAGTLPEADFLKGVKWGSTPFEPYREQIIAPRGTSGQTIALNIPRSVPGKVGRGEVLDANDQKLLPPVWVRGNDAYFERFSEIMKEHVPADKLENYFMAQSLWDATMTWKAMEHMKANPDKVMVIIVGGFHVEYGGGLPFELIRQGQAGVKTMLQVEASDWADATLRMLVQPDAKYGERADYLWVHQGAVK